MNGLVENKYYIKSEKDCEGPFSDINSAIMNLAEISDREFSTPQMLSSCICQFKNGSLQECEDDNKSPIKGSKFYWRNEVVVGGKTLWKHSSNRRDDEKVCR